MDSQRLCKDCRHYLPSDVFVDACALAESVEPVRGRVQFEACIKERISGKCGPAATLWEQRPVEQAVI
jgi:hypothetical protein